MSRRYQVKHTDNNEKEIVAALRAIPHVSVETDKDDILIGYKGRTYWIEIKNPNEVGKDGLPYKNEKNKTRSKTYLKQKALLDHWCGHYSICSTLDQVLSTIGIKNGR